MIAETSRPPVPQQAGRKAKTILAGFEIAVVRQDFEHICNTPLCIIDHYGIFVRELSPSSSRKRPLRRRFGENLHGDGVARVVQPVLETCLVVHKVVLP